MEEVWIRDDSIRLGQVLKLSGFVEDGVMAKELIQDEQVLVNGEINSRRSSTVNVGDVIAVPALDVEFTITRG